MIVIVGLVIFVKTLPLDVFPKCKPSPVVTYDQVLEVTSLASARPLPLKAFMAFQALIQLSQP